VVKAVMLDQPRGAVLISGDAGEIRLQTGPVVTGTAIRDALPAVNFDDFPDQIAFAEVGQQLNERAIAAVRRDLSRLRPGDRVTVVGVTNLASTDEVVVLTPLTIAPGERAQ
jgi:predicted lipoprotein